MALSDTIPSTLVVKSRDEWAKYWLRSYGNRLAANLPSADVAQATSPGSSAWIDAMALADCLAVQSANSQTIAATALVANMSEAQLISKGDELGVPWPAATGASGYVICQAGSNGTTIQPGDVLSNELTRMRYEHAVTTPTTYSNGDAVPISGVDTGPLSNAEAGTQLTWDSPRSGCFAHALVDSNGLTDGHDKASIEEYRSIIIYAEANESASGNEAAVIKWAQDSLHHGVAVEKAFAYPGIYGAGTTGLVFTLSPSQSGGSRIPNGTQISLVAAYVQSQLPADDGLIACPLVTRNPTLIGRVDWSDGAAQWANFSPWPNYVASIGSSGDGWVVTAVTDATHFTVGLVNGVYTSAQSPSIGNVFGVFDQASGKFFKKTILSFTGTGPWAIVCDTTSGQSDTTITPTVWPVVADTAISPWSDSLQDVADTMIAYVNTMGPGEQIAIADELGDGRKMLRTPRPNAKSWPISITSKLESNVTALSIVDSFSLVVPELGSPSATVPMGNQATFSYLFTNPVLEIFSL